MISIKKTWEIISKIVLGMTVTSKRQGQNCGSLTNKFEFKCTVLQIKLISYNVGDTQ